MTDAEIEQARKSIEPPLASLYVDAKGEERSNLFIDELVRLNVLNAVTAEMARGMAYEGTGTLLAPFLTVEAARAVQQPGQNIVIAGYATIGAARVNPLIPAVKPFVPCEVPTDIKERCS